jgi:hypothetical protein
MPHVSWKSFFGWSGSPGISRSARLDGPVRWPLFSTFSLTEDCKPSNCLTQTFADL